MAEIPDTVTAKIERLLSLLEAKNITEGVVADFDSDGNLVAFEILAAKGKINFHDLLIDSLPFENMNFMRETTTP